MKLKDLKLDDDLEIPDIPTMYEMSDDEYRDYVQDDGIFWVDHHDNLRERSTGRPIATTLEQFDILIKELMKHRDRMTPKKKDWHPKQDLENPGFHVAPLP